MSIQAQIEKPTTPETRERVCGVINPLMEQAFGPGHQIKPSWLQLYEYAVTLYVHSPQSPIAAALVENMSGGKWRSRFEATALQRQGYGTALFQEIEKLVRNEERQWQREDGEVAEAIKLFAFVDKENMDTHGKFMEKLGFRALSEDEVDAADIECEYGEIAFCKILE